MCIRKCSTRALAVAFVCVTGLSSLARGEYVFSYRFEEGPDGGSVATLVDSGPNGLNGTAHGGITYTSDAPLGAGNFALDATGDYNYAQVADNSLMHLQEFTIEAYVHPAEPYDSGGGEQYHVIVTKKFAEEGYLINSFALCYDAGTDKFKANVGFGVPSDPDAGVRLETENTFLGGNWYHVALSLDRDVSGETDLLSLYVNGQLQASELGEFPNIKYTSQELVIGAANYEGKPDGRYRRNFNGFIDEVQLSTAIIPAPSTVVGLLSMGVMGLVIAGFRRRKK